LNHIRINRVEVRPAGKLHIWFSDGLERDLDFSALIKRGGVFAPLADPAVFAAVEIVDHGHCIEWPDEVDIGADSLYTGPALVGTREHSHVTSEEGVSKS
jgi:hypothetical protein